MKRILDTFIVNPYELPSEIVQEYKSLPLLHKDQVVFKFLRMKNKENIFIFLAKKGVTLDILKEDFCYIVRNISYAYKSLSEKLSSEEYLLYRKWMIKELMVLYE